MTGGSDSQGSKSRQRSVTREFFLGSGLTYLEFAAKLVGGLIAVPVLLHALGAVGYGVYVYITAGASTLSLTGLGLGMTSAKQMAHAGDPNSREAAAAATCALAVFATAAMTVTGLGALLAPSLAAWGGTPASLVSEAVVLGRWSALSVGLGILSSGLNGFLMSSMELTRLQLLRVTERLALVAATVLPAIMGVGLGGIGLWQATSAVFFAVLRARSVAATTQAWSAIDVRLLNWPELRNFVSFGGAVSITQLHELALRQLDHLIIGATLGPVAVSAYAVAQRLCIFAGQLVNAPLRAAYAVFVRARASGRVDEMASWFCRLGTILTTVAVFASANYAAWGRDLCRIWTGTDLAVPFGLFVILGGELILRSIALLSQIALVAHGREWLVARTCATEVVIKVVLTWTLVAHTNLGIVGAAAASLLTGLFATGWRFPTAAASFLDLAPKQLASVFLSRPMAGAGVAAGITIGLSWAVGKSPASPLIVLGAGLASGALAAIGLWRLGLETSDRAWVSRRLSKLGFRLRKLAG